MKVDLQDKITKNKVKLYTYTVKITVLLRQILILREMQLNNSFLLIAGKTSWGGHSNTIVVGPYTCVTRGFQNRP